MLLKVFRGTGPGVIFLIIISLAIFWISAFINPKLPVSAIYEIKPMPLYGIIKLLIGNNSLLGVIFSFLIQAIMLFMVISFNTSVFFINERTFLPAFIYLLFSSLFPQYLVLNPVLPATLFLMLAVMRIMDSYRKPGIAFNFFDAAILISIASLFYANLIWFGLLVIIGITLLRTVNIGEIALSLLGLATPYILTIGLYYVLGKDLGIFLSDIKDNLFGETAGYRFQRLTIIVLIYSGLIVLISLGFLSTQMNSKKIKSRKTFYLLFWWFLISLALYFILPSISVEMIWITSIPASYFLAHYFIFVKKKLLPEIIFTGFFLLILLIQIFYIF
jgi:hypothetical protein